MDGANACEMTDLHAARKSGSHDNAAGAHAAQRGKEPLSPNEA